MLGYVAEVRPGILKCLPGVSLVGMSRSGATTLCHFLLGFRMGWLLRLQDPLGRYLGAGRRALW